jgi:hypothetical protein
VETEWQRMEWIHLAQDRAPLRAVVNTPMNIMAPQRVRIILLLINGRIRRRGLAYGVRLWQIYRQ